MLTVLLLIIAAVVPASAAPPDPLLVSLHEAGEMLGISYRSVLRMVNAGELRTLKLRQRRLVPVAAIHELIAERLAG